MKSLETVPVVVESGQPLKILAAEVVRSHRLIVRAEQFLPLNMTVHAWWIKALAFVTLQSVDGLGLVTAERRP